MPQVAEGATRYAMWHAMVSLTCGGRHCSSLLMRLWKYLANWELQVLRHRLGQAQVSVTFGRHPAVRDVGVPRTTL